MSPAWRVHVIGWLLLLPAAVLLVAFTHYPVAATIYTSLFSNPKAGRAAVWVGAVLVGVGVVVGQRQEQEVVEVAGLQPRSDAARVLVAHPRQPELRAARRLA